MSGNEPGTNVLVRPATATGAGVRLTVEEVVRTRHFTRVTLVAENTTTDQVSLNLFANCTLRGADGTVVKADSFRSDWSEELPPGVGPQRGRVTFEGRLPPHVTRATLSFGHVFRFGFGNGPTSVNVPVELRATRP